MQGGHKGCQNQNSQPDYKTEKLMMMENLNHREARSRRGKRGLPRGTKLDKGMAKSKMMRSILVEALPMRTSNEYEYEYGLFLYNAALILDIFCSRQKK